MKKLLALLLTVCVVMGCTGTVCGETSDQEKQPLLLQDLIGLWEFESASFLGRSITAEELSGSTGDAITMEFTSDGLWIMQIGPQNMMAELVVHDDGTVEAPENQSFQLEDGKLLFIVNGMTQIYTRSDLPGREPSAAPDEAKLGTWRFEKVVYSGGDFPSDIPLEADMFSTVYGIPAPTLQVRKNGLALMKLGDEIFTFTAEEWAMEDGKLTYTETHVDGTNMAWTFVRENAETAAEEPLPETVEPLPTDEAPPVEATESGDSFTFRGAVWGMTREEVRALVQAEPIQEPTSAAGHTALVYQFTGENGFCLVQYNFLPSGALYNITVIAPDEDGAFYAGQRETFTALYGEPLPETGADLESDDDPVAVMMAALMQNSGDSDFLGWRADDETVIIMSMEPVNKVCYVEIRRYTDYFRFE